MGRWLSDGRAAKPACPTCCRRYPCSVLSRTGSGSGSLSGSSAIALWRLRDWISRTFAGTVPPRRLILLAVMQDIGVNQTIIQDGINGFLASTPEQWEEQLSRLVEDADLRRRIGRAARETVVQHYSMFAWRDRYLQLFNELLKRKDNVRTEKNHAHAHS